MAIKKARVIRSAALLASLCIAVSALHAETSTSPEEEKNWMLLLGGIASYSPVYSGSDEYGIGFAPLIIGSYHWNRVSVYIEGEEAGLNFQPFAKLPFTASAGIMLGRSRDEDEDATLDGMGDMNNPIQAFAKISYGPEWLTANSRMRYAPTQKDSEPFRHSFLWDEYLEAEAMLGPVMANAKAGVSFMDSTWSSIAYDEDAGIESAFITVDVLIMATKHLGVYCGGDATLLLGNAADSKISQLDRYAGGRVGVFYMF